ncbi:MAG: TIM barrel protein [Bacteroidota bacterium]|nr:TIM barrel protein [Bacteroidota bacterium]MDP4248939.1 TIM barrel protein [Bacteroidota bacterium]
MNFNRRHFIKTSSSATTALLLASLDAFAESPKQPHAFMNNNFELIILGTDWGYKGTIDSCCAKLKSDGFDGIEIWWPQQKAKQDDLFAALKKYQLQVGLLISGDSGKWAEHLSEFKKNIDASAYNTYQKPIYINCHSGRDFFTREENQAFIDYTNALSKKTGIPIHHETHRSRMLFAAPATRQFIEKNPDLRLTLDISHWCTVHNSLLDDQVESVNIALPRVDHIHARIGHPDGPQVNDPRAPEWDDCVKAHFAWWDSVVAMKKKNGGRLTILTEFGPPDYMPALPYTRQPLADQWAINVYIMQTLRKRYLS